MLFFVVNIKAQSANSSGSLTFNVTGFVDNSGQLLVQLFRKSDKVPAKPFKVIKAKIVANKSVVVVENLPFGEYAAILVHDKNMNGHIDHSWGIPNEPLGYTNNWKLSILSGMPTFEKLKIIFSDTNNVLKINMQEVKSDQK